MGYLALSSAIGVDFQTAIGYQALRNSTTGTQNLALGYQAGSGITTGSNNIAIGYNAQVPSGTLSNQLSIGNWIYGSGGNIGIGTSTPGQKLTISGGTIQIVNGSQAAGYILTSDANGVATWLPAVASSNGWLVTGNAGTSSSTNFLGTLDAQDLVVKTNSGEKMRILSSVSSTGALIFVNGGDIVVNGMTVGHGSGAIQTNTAI